MSTRRLIPNVLNAFLGTFASRNSDFNGYWLFGFLVEEIFPMRIELLHEMTDRAESESLTFARRLAAREFWRQAGKNGVRKAWIREAYLTITKLPFDQSCVVNGWGRTVHTLAVVARVITDLGKTYEETASIYVAPHDPKLETRSTRGG